jgi:hypothetical protein
VVRGGVDIPAIHADAAPLIVATATHDLNRVSQVRKTLANLLNHDDSVLRARVRSSELTY